MKHDEYSGSLCPVFTVRPLLFDLFRFPLGSRRAGKPTHTRGHDVRPAEFMVSLPPTCALTLPAA